MLCNVVDDLSNTVFNLQSHKAWGCLPCDSPEEMTYPQTVRRNNKESFYKEPHFILNKSDKGL